ncbi:MAG: hypothetical protein QM811_25665 [Pirellulales bacterium]
MASQNHVVRTNAGFEMVPRTDTGFEDAYVDIRNFSMSDWWNHKTLAADILTHKPALRQDAVQAPLQNLLNTSVPQTPAQQQRSW